MAIVLPPLVQRVSPNQSSRNGARIDLLVWHETAGSYRSAVEWLCNPAADASAHLVLREDGREATQLVPLARKAWTQGAFNPRSVGLEHANVTAKGFHSEQQLEVSARIFGWLCLKYAIPPRWARAGAGRGICRHLDLGAAGGGHYNCGMSDFDFGRFVEMVGDEIDRGGYKQTWLK